ncbi:MAG: ATP-binding protein [Thermodesulfovibrionales bacterium]
MSGKQDTYPKKGPLSVLIILIAATFVTATGTLLQYRRAVGATEDSLLSQALGIAVSLEASLKDRDLARDAAAGDLFRDIIAGGQWEGIAFLALYDGKGTTLLHSNKDLIGRRVEDPSLSSVAASGMPVHAYTTLGTGERVFVLYFPVHIQAAERVLRLAIHPYPAEKAVRGAQLQAASIFGVLVLLWILGCFLMRAVQRSEELKRTMAERERLALLGEMSSVLAHEIRNPLGSIKGFAQFLLEQTPAQRAEAGSAAADEYLRVIVAESERLETLTADLLLYAKPVEVRRQTFSVRDLAEEVIASLRPSPEEEGGAAVRHRISPGLTLTSDRDKLKQVLLNVVQNAVDAAGKNGRVEVRAGTSGAPFGEAFITVEDNGCGMDQALQARAFSPFFTTKTRGTGLGLAIVGKLVQALGGSVELQSAPQKGTVVRIALPGGQGNSPLESFAAESAEDAEQKTV